MQTLGETDLVEEPDATCRSEMGVRAWGEIGHGLAVVMAAMAGHLVNKVDARSARKVRQKSGLPQWPLWV